MTEKFTNGERLSLEERLLRLEKHVFGEEFVNIQEPVMQGGIYGTVKEELQDYEDDVVVDEDDDDDDV